MGKLREIEFNFLLYLGVDDFQFFCHLKVGSYMLKIH